MTLSNGQRVRLLRAVSFEENNACWGGRINIELPAGETGQIVEMGGEGFVIVRMDNEFRCLKPWENTVTFDFSAKSQCGVGLVSTYLQPL